MPRFKDYDGWKKSLEANKDGGYREAVSVFVLLWASLMEVKIIFEKKPVAEVAEACEKQANALMGDYGMTGFQYGCAVSILSQVWEYGEELRCWHNLRTQISDEGTKANESGGVLNPALLNLESRLEG